MSLLRSRADLLRCLLLVFFVAALATLAPAWAQDAPQPAAIAKLDAAKAKLDLVEGALGRGEAVAADELAEHRRMVLEARDDLRGIVEEVEPRAGEIEARLKQLGSTPASDAGAEEEAIATERESLKASFGQFDAALKQGRLLLVRCDQLIDRIAEQRRGLYARELFARGASAVDPWFWVEAAEALRIESRSFIFLARSWSDTLARSGVARQAPAGALLILILMLAVLITRWWLPRLDASPRADTRFSRARTALSIFLWLAIRSPVAVAAAILVLSAFGLLPPRIRIILDGLAVGIAAASIGRAAARALFAPDRPQRRVVELDEATALCFHDHLVWSTRALGAGIFLQTLHKTLFAPLSVTVATNALLAIVFAGLLIHLVLTLRRAERRGVDELIVRAPGGHLAGWLVASAILCAVTAGYAAFGAFIALRVIVAGVVFATLYLLLVVTDALFTEALAADTRQGRSIAANLGLSPRNVGLVGVLLSAGIRVALIVFGLMLIVGPWEVSTADFIDSMQSVPLGFKVGEINISFRAILTAAALLVVILLVTRAAQRWLEREFLPRTTLEPSLQLSIATIFGYVGAIIAVALGLAGLGIDLQKIALVAGALSVGIGFGLQAIVSNFVSGLILLAERPIRVGDSIVVKGEEGWVRRIRVRATEIETYERASVIIPNSELITGMVKNWTHANTMGRIIVKVGVGYDSDPELVRELLQGVAAAHPQIVQTPPPRAFFIGFGASSLDFELRCVVGNVENGLSVKSDLNIAVLKQLRAASIEIPYPQQDIRVRGDKGGPVLGPA